MAFVYGTPEWEEAYKRRVAERMESEPKPFIYFTPEWADVYEKKIQEDAGYREAAKNWEGSVTLHVEQKPELGVDMDIYLLMDLWHGRCRSLRLVPREAGEKADFVISGSLERWISVGKKELDPVKGMMQGKLRLKGDLPTIVRNVKAAVSLVDLSAQMGGRYPDELGDREREGLKLMIATLGKEFGLL